MPSILHSVYMLDVILKGKCTVRSEYIMVKPVLKEKNKLSPPSAFSKIRHFIEENHYREEDDTLKVEMPWHHGIFFLIMLYSIGARKRVATELLIKKMQLNWLFSGQCIRSEAMPQIHTKSSIARMFFSV